MTLSSGLYAKPVFARGTGLGNRLFQWARCRCWCYEHGARMLAPSWRRLGLGPLLRQTVPLDQFLGRIALWGQFVQHPDDLHPGWELGLRLRCRLSQEHNDPRWHLDSGERMLRLFNGRDDSFTRLNAHQGRLKLDLWRSVARRHRRRVDAVAVPPIGINIRLGKDFSAPPLLHSGAGDEGAYGWIGWLQQTPVSWFVETLQLIRQQAGWPVPAVVVSDGSAVQLEALLALPAVHWLAPSNAVVDLWTLSRTQLLLGSGSSTFSAWAAFLGQQPAFTAPGHPLSQLSLQPQRGQCIAAFDPRDPNPDLLTAMLAAVDHSER